MHSINPLDFVLDFMLKFLAAQTPPKATKKAEQA
jgi:hypothetical protein